MNIVKFQDKIIDPTMTPGLSEEQCELFNEQFKGRYVHCLNWTHCVPMEVMTAVQAIRASQDLQMGLLGVLDSYPHLPYEHLDEFIDPVLTDVANDIDKYITFNSFSPSKELTWDQIKKFRTWLAQTILSFNIVLDHDTTHMLDYYAGGMYNDVIAALTTFGSTTLSLTTVNTPGCGCAGSSAGVTQSVVATTLGSSQCGCAGNQNLSNLYAQGLANCNPLWIYRKNIYLKMVNVFSEIDFWTQFECDFIQEFKLYIDNIIRMNLSLVASAWQSDFVDCGCINDQYQAQMRNIERLRHLSQALELIYNSMTGGDPIKGHTKYIASALNEWATFLYETMEWQ